MEAGRNTDEIVIGEMVAEPLGCRVISVGDRQLLEAAGKARWLNKAATYAQADLLAEARNRSRDLFEAVAERMGLTYAEGKKALQIAAVPIENRRTEATPAHTRIVGRELSVEEQRRWLALAIEHKLTPRELARSIQQGTLVRKSQKTETFKTPRAVRMAFASWLGNLGKGSWRKLSKPALQEILAELQDIELTVRAMREYVKGQGQFDFANEADAEEMAAKRPDFGGRKNP